MTRPFIWLKSTRPKVPSPGLLALAALTICTGSGVILALSYRPDAALDSLALLLMKNPAGILFRSVHYWSAQFFLVSCLWHGIEHLARRSEIAVGRGVWLRLTFVVPVILYAMLSGFLLRAGSGGTQAGLILHSLLNEVPGLGGLLASVFTGPNQTLFVAYLHHVCTATLVIWLVSIEHSRRIMPGRQAVFWIILPVLLLALVLVPGLESAPARAEHGPWYLAGLQEILHWLPGPGWLVALCVLALGGLAMLPWLAAKARTGVKRGMVGGLVLYAILSVLALGFRGQGWRFGWAGAARPSAFRSARAYLAPPARLLEASVPLIDGKREGCLVCHIQMAGFQPAHDPNRIGCASCHLGERFTLDKALAHKGMTLTPGNLCVVRQTCASESCHSEIGSRVRRSLMTTMSGVISVDKFVFGENPDLDHRFDVRQLSSSPADKHLRSLCASCHLGQDKDEPGTISELSRGGGCSACHLGYGDAAREELASRASARTRGQPPRFHPEISTSVQGQACFGCHSRSGRISLSFEGWHETTLEEDAIKRTTDWQKRFRILADDRVLEKHEPDIHYQKGMQCVDCHLASEAMGDGQQYAHQENAVKIGCVDCHPEESPKTRVFEQLDAEARKIIALRNLNEPGRKFLVTRSGVADSRAYPNVYLGNEGRLSLKTVLDGRVLEPKPATEACGRDIPGHRRLECRACHSAWVPQCIGCHTSFEPKAEGWDHLAGRALLGTWQEQSSEMLAEAPVLGVQKIATPTKTYEERIGTFAPGMVMTLTRESRNSPELHRLYAPVSPHTSSRSRSCVSCHANPVALGFGRGSLQYETNGAFGCWTFKPRFATATQDGLPLDAWIGFLQEPAPGIKATRGNCRPFTLPEQQRILRVGSCFQCHDEGDQRLQAVFSDFQHYRAHLSEHCLLPNWGDSG